MNTKIKALFAFIIIFLLGVAAGYFLNNTIHRTGQPIFSETGSERGQVDSRRFSDGMAARRQPDNERRRQWIENHFTQELNLEELQRDQFFEKITEYNTEIRRKIGEQRSNEREFLIEFYNEFRKNLSEILTQEQLIKLDEMIHPDSVRQMRMERLRQGRSR